MSIPHYLPFYCICNRMGPWAIKDYFHLYFQSFPKLPLSLRNSGNFGKTLKIQVKIILNCPRALSIACLSHKGQKFWRNYIRARCPRDEAPSIPPEMSKLTQLTNRFNEHFVPKIQLTTLQGFIQLNCSQ